MPLTNSLTSENEVKTFLSYLINAYVNEEDTSFELLLRNSFFRNLIEQRIKIIENIQCLSELGK